MSKWKDALQPYAEEYADLRASVETLDDEELRELHTHAQRAGTSNCWWATYRVAQLIQRWARKEMGRRLTAEEAESGE